MADEESFLVAIKAAPADDAPRLIYADWLDENGRNQQAELIRVECQFRSTKVRLDSLLKTTHHDWLARVFPKYKLIVHRFPIERRVDVVVLIRQLTGCDLVKARELVNQSPIQIEFPTTIAELDEMRKLLVRLGADCELKLVES